MTRVVASVSQKGGHVFGTLVRQLSYQPALAALVRALHLQAPARRAYYWLFRQEGGAAQLRCSGLAARFHAPNPQEFRTIELAMTSERSTLESLLSALNPGDVFWDIGSNRGLFAVKPGS